LHERFIAAASARKTGSSGVQREMQKRNVSLSSAVYIASSFRLGTVGAASASYTLRAKLAPLIGSRRELGVAVLAANESPPNLAGSREPER